MTTVHLTINSDVNPDKVITFISELCRQENLDFSVDVERGKSNEAIFKQREQFRKPLLVGDNLAIKVLTTHNKHFKTLDQYTFTDRVVMNIESGGGFGVGTHPTTQMCIGAIEKYLKPNMTVLDIGCGSGILSLVALLFGAGHAVGVDIKKSATEAFKKNAELNHISDDKFSVIQGDLVESVSGKYDLIVANILADPIKELFKNLHNYTHDDSIIIISGIVDFRANEIEEVAQCNFEIIEKETQDNWVCYVMRHKH